MRMYYDIIQKPGPLPFSVVMIIHKMIGLFFV
jgi:hypothetical protein